MIGFHDFVPQIKDKGGFFRAAEFCSMDETLQKVNDWVSANNVDVINVETVVLPNMHDRGEEGPQDPSLHTSGEMRSSWHQFLRVWYRT